MALALYRKYRPARLADVVGQGHVTEPLATALAAGRVSHAYLFSGPRGCGKTSSARILARSLNCEQGPTPDPCGVCPSCVSLAPEGPGNIDVVELDAASHGGVDDARELRDRAFYAPAESRYRVFIVDEAHMVTTQGFNALLKIVEEPPEHLVFVFATTEPDKVLSTIRSRTHHYPFRLIPPGTLRGLLERICAEEGAVVAPAVFPLVIRAGGGSARDTLSVLDQLLAGAGPEGVTYERAVALLGVTDVALIDDVVDALAAGDRAAVFEAVDRLVEAGHDPRRFAADLLQRLRDLMLLQAVPDAPGRGLVDAADDEVARMVEQAGKLGAATLARYGEILHTGLTEMRGATAPRLLLELMCARMLLPAASLADTALLERLERIERRAAIASAPPAPGEAVAPDPDGDASADGRRTFTRPSRTADPSDGAGAPDTPDEAAAGAVGRAAVDAAPAGPADPPRAAPTVRSGERAPGTAEPGDRAPVGGGSPARAVPAEPAAAPATAGSGAPRPGPGEPRPGAPRPGPGEPRPGAPAAPDPSRGTAPRPAGAGPVPAEPAAARRPPERPVTPAGGPQAPAAGEPRRAERPTPPARPAARPEPAPAPAASALDAAAVRRVWSEVLAAAKQRSRSTEALLVGATVRAVDGDVLVLAIGSAPLARRLSDSRNTDVIAEALHAVLGVRWRVRCEHGDAAPAPTRSAAAPAAARRPPPVRRSAPVPAPDDGVPLPPEPPDEDAPPDDEESMLAEAAADAAAGPAVRRDPQEVAIELLTTQLGAKAIDQG